MRPFHPIETVQAENFPHCPGCRALRGPGAQKGSPALKDSREQKGVPRSPLPGPGTQQNASPVSRKIGGGATRWREALAGDSGTLNYMTYKSLSSKVVHVGMGVGVCVCART